MMSLNEKLVKELAIDFLIVEKKLEDIGFEVVGIKDINNENLFLVRKKK